MVRVLFISHSSDFTGGAARSLIEVSEWLHENDDIQCSYFTPRTGDFSDAANSIGTFYSIDYFQNCLFFDNKLFKNILRFARFLIYDLANRHSAKKAIKKYAISRKQFDIIYINDTGNTFGYYLAKELELPFIWHCRSYSSKIKRYLPSEKRLRKEKIGGCFIAISNAMKQSMLKHRGIYPSNIHLIYNGLETNNYPYFDWNKRANNEYHILQCSSVLRVKQQHIALEALKLLKEKYCNVYLHIVGKVIEKKYYDYLKLLIKKYNLTNSVFFEGTIKDMRSFREKMTIEILPSTEEAFGRVIVEAMQSGLVVIGNDDGGIPEIIRHNENGLLFEKNSAVSLYENIDAVILNKCLGERLSKAAYDFSKSHFTISETSSKIAILIEEVLRKNEKDHKPFI